MGQTTGLHFLCADRKSGGIRCPQNHLDLSGALEALGGYSQQLRGSSEIAIAVRDLGLTEIGGEMQYR